ncbi:MAG: hypothetical protein IKQ10_06860 [Oscillospiraceae bacterium]|nr:hypothetical protein [Oscillospiraceae bacterium]
MKQVPVKLGPLALLLTVISICLTVLAILIFTTARADLRLAEKYARTVQTRYALEVRGQEFLADARNAASGGGLSPTDGLDRDADGVYWHTIEQDGSLLKIGLRQQEGELTVEAWRHERLWEEDDSLNLWLGN